MYSCVIIDDESRSVETLKTIVERYFENKLNVVGTASNADDGFEIISNTQPDIVFLDIEMPGKSGFDMLEMFKSPDFQVIFTTGFDHYAITAIKFSAIDYILKPINIIELKDAVNKAIDKIKNNIGRLNLSSLLDNIRSPKDKNNKIPLPVINGLQMIQISKIVYCEADEDYTYVYLANNERLLVTKSIKDFEDMLTEYDFFRVHHSFLLNKQFIKKYIKGEGGIVVTDIDKEVPVSRRRKSDFLDWLNAL